MATARMIWGAREGRKMKDKAEWVGGRIKANHEDGNGCRQVGASREGS